MTLKPVFRYSPSERTYRIARLVWHRGTVGDGAGYSNKLSLSLWPRLFRWQRGSDGWTVVLFGVRVHYARSYGGVFV